MLKGNTYDKKLETISKIIEANRNRGGVTYTEMVKVLTIMFDYKFNRSNSQMVKKLLEYNESLANPYIIDEKLLYMGKSIKFKTPIVIPNEIKQDYEKKKFEREELGIDSQLIKKLTFLQELIKNNKERGITKKEAELFLRKVFKQKKLRIEKVISFGYFYGKPIERKSFVREPKDMQISIPSEWVEKTTMLPKKYDKNYNWSKKTAYDEKLKLTDIVNNNNECIHKIFLDKKLIKAESLCGLYEDLNQNVFDKVVQDLVDKYGINFKIFIFEDDIYSLDSSKTNMINFNILKFISTAENNIKLIRKKRPNSCEKIIRFCIENKATLVSGSEKILAMAMLENVEVYVPKVYVKSTPNPLKGKGLLVLDSNINSEAEIKMLCEKFGSIALSDIQFEEVGKGGYLVKICAYYGKIEKAPELIEGNKDRTIVEFAKKIHSDMFFSKDYGCIAFAKMQEVPCKLVISPHHSESTALKLIHEAEKKKNTKNCKNIEQFVGCRIMLDLCEINQTLKTGMTRINTNNFTIELKSSMYKNCNKLENGGYIFLKNDTFSMQIRVINKEKKLGKIVSIRKFE